MLTSDVPILGMLTENELKSLVNVAVAVTAESGMVNVAVLLQNSLVTLTALLLASTTLMSVST